jgi:hypothetical protein
MSPSMAGRCNSYSLFSSPGLTWLCLRLPMHPCNRLAFGCRVRDKDIPYLIRSISYILRTASAPLFLIFPEGTDLSDSNKVKSHACESPAITMLRVTIVSYVNRIYQMPSNREFLG